MWRVVEGDCLERMRELDEGSVDAVVTDPPYGIGFMGKEWDAPTIARAAERDAVTRASLGPESPSRPGRAQPRSSSAFGSAAHYAGPVRAGREWQEWCERWASEALRVLKPGGHLLAFGGTRTYHRLACAVEDAGFEIRDTICWLYGSGFPKSLDVSKAIDKAAGAERDVVGLRTYGEGQIYGGGAAAGGSGGGIMGEPAERGPSVQTAPATPEAERWQGWGTALKPAHEPVVVARKPLAGTVARNVQEYGTGALNIDGCRVGTDDLSAEYDRADFAAMGYGGAKEGHVVERPGKLGRWPANVALDGEAAAMLDEQSGTLQSGANPTRRGSDRSRTAYGDFEGQRECEPARGADSGGASRFFYCAKASRAERNAGLDGFEKKPIRWSSGEQSPGTFQADGTEKAARNAHPTVKPIVLMRWLVRLVTPPGGTVLDPGSGTTGIAAVLEGFDFVGVEREPEYVEIARARIDHWARQPVQLGLEAA